MAITTRRTYGQFCPIAVGLDLIGDRWVLLIIRELSFADCRFSELRRALPGLAPNLLTERLRDLSTAGLIEQISDPATASRSRYHLTENGAGALPVLRAMARFGVRYLDDPAAEDHLSATRVIGAFLFPWARYRGIPLRIRLNLDQDSADMALDADGARLLCDEGAPDLEITSTVKQIAQARRTDVPLIAEVIGSVSHRQAFSAAFAMALDSDHT